MAIRLCKVCGDWHDLDKPWPHSRAGRGHARLFLELALTYQSDNCLNWPFSGNGNGYGSLKLDRRTQYAHRVVCEMVHGSPPEESFEAAHSCGNRKCVNSRHLRWATHQENHQDRIAHGTSNRGHKNGNARLNESAILEIRAAKDAEHRKLMAEKYGVSTGAISSVVNGKTWGWVYAN